MLNEDFNEAIDSFKRTLSFDLPPAQFFLVHYGLAKCFTALKENNKAKVELDNSVKHADNKTLKYWQIQLHYIKDNTNKPSRFVKEAVEYVSENRTP